MMAPAKMLEFWHRFSNGWYRTIELSGEPPRTIHRNPHLTVARLLEREWVEPCSCGCQLLILNLDIGLGPRLLTEQILALIEEMERDDDDPNYR